MDIFDFALKMERESEKYYREQAGKTDFLDLRILLEKLADTEAKHYEIVEALRSQNNDLLPEDWTLEETKNIFDSYIKDTEAMCKAISIKKDKTEQIDIYRLALVKEKIKNPVFNYEGKDFRKYNINMMDEDGLKKIGFTKQEIKLKFLHV